MAIYAPDVTTSESAATAWTSGQLLARAVAELGDTAKTQPITNTMILKGLGMIKNENLGGLVLGHDNFNTGAPVTGNPCVGFASLNNGKWSAPEGDSAFCG